VSKIAGHSTVRMTEEYTKIQMQRQEELTCAIQHRLAAAGEKAKKAADEEPPPIVVSGQGSTPLATEIIQ
jgi:hypothetical protein